MQQQSNAIHGLQKALAEAQGEFTLVPKKKTARVKSQRTGVEYTFKYADLADVLAMALPILSKHGLALSQPHLIVEGKLRVCTKLMHASGEWQMSDGIEISEDGSPQDFGAESTYFRRYDACSLLGIAPDEDTETAAVAERPAVRQPQRQDPKPAAKPEEKPKPYAPLQDLGTREELVARIVASGFSKAELASRARAAFPQHKNTASLSLEELGQFLQMLMKAKKEASAPATASAPVDPFDETVPPHHEPVRIPDDIAAMLDGGELVKGSEVKRTPAAPIGKTRAHLLHKIIGVHKKRTDAELKEKILAPLNLEHLSELPDDLYNGVVDWAEGKLDIG